LISDLSSRWIRVVESHKHKFGFDSFTERKIAAFCRLNGHDLMTGDKRSYVEFFKAGVKTVQIGRRDIWKSEKPIFLIKILD
jgi:hypothetical protein